MAAGFIVTKLEILSNGIHIPPKLARYPLSTVGIAGAKLLAVVDPSF
jgi:hypothetical protein